MEKIRNRRHYPTFRDSVIEEFTRTFDLKNHQWIHTLLNPVQAAVIVEEKRRLDNAVRIPETAQ